MKTFILLFLSITSLCSAQIPKVIISTLIVENKSNLIYTPFNEGSKIPKDGCTSIENRDVKQKGEICSFAYNGASNYPILVIDSIAKQFVKKSINNCSLTINSTKEESIYSYRIQWTDAVPLSCLYSQSFIFVHYNWLTLRFKILSTNIEEGIIKGKLSTSTVPHHIPIREKTISCWIEIVNPKVEERQDIHDDQYIYDGDSIHYKLPKGVDTSPLTIKVADLETLLIIRNCRNLTFKGFRFKNNGTKDITTGSGYQAEMATPPCILIEHSDSITFEDCEFTGIVGYCIKASGENHHLSNINIRNCLVENTFGGGFHLSGCHNSTIGNCTIKKFGMLQGGSVGLLLRQDIQNCYLLHNTICYGPYTGISVGWTWGFNSNSIKSKTYSNTIAYNHIHHCMMGKSDDGGGIYTLGESKGTVISENCIHHIYARKKNSASAVYFDEGSSGIIFNSNVCYDCDRFVHLHYGYNIEISNNLFVNCENTAFRLSNSKDNFYQQQAFLTKNNIINIQNCDFLDNPSQLNFLFSNNLLRAINCNLPVFKKDVVHYRKFHQTSTFLFSSELFLGENGIIKFNNRKLPEMKVSGFKIHTRNADFRKIDILENPNLCGSPVYVKKTF